MLENPLYWGLMNTNNRHKTTKIKSLPRIQYNWRRKQIKQIARFDPWMWKHNISTRKSIGRRKALKMNKLFSIIFNIFNPSTTTIHPLNASTNKPIIKKKKLIKKSHHSSIIFPSVISNFYLWSLLNFHRTM